VTSAKRARFRIGVTTSMIYGNQEGGLQRYIDSLLRDMPLSDDDEIIVYAPDCHAGFRCFSDARPRRPGKLRRARVRGFWNHPLRNIFWHLFVYPARLRLDGVQLLWLPELRRQVPLFAGPSITTIHDMARYRIPGKYDRFRMFFHLRVLPLLMRNNRRYVAVSSNTRADIHAFLRIPLAKIAHIPNGIDAELFEPRAGDRAPDGVRRPYFLYVARFEHPGKNHLRLIAAFERFSSRRPGYTLVLVGSVWLRGEIILQAIRGTKAAVLHLGFLSDAHLRGLYAEAEALVFPSLYEGFGLPILEAMACGAPVASSDRSSLPEVCGDAALLFDPEDEEAIAKTMERIASDADLREGLKRKGAERVKEFSWRKSAERYMGLFREVYGEAP
jgi:glycosyltransferase involved in cell wall biosynthesis